jgi:hypothetical protein
MTAPLLAQRLARLLARSLPETAPLPDDREATIGAMRRALRARRIRRARVRWLGGVAAAAALAFGTIAAVRGHRSEPTAGLAAPAVADVVAEHVSGGVLVLSGGHTSPLLDSQAIGTGDHVLAMLDGQATIELTTGTRLSVAGGGDVALLSGGPTQVFALGAGGVRADVAKLHPGQRFVLRTADAEIEVRGTSFRVSTAVPDPTCGRGTTTRVEVFEGVVTVRAGTTEATVRPGESWPQGCGEPSRVGSRGEPLAVPGVAAPAASAEQSSVPRPALPQSELAVQNDMFEAAMQAKRRGDLRGAVASFDRLLSRYPGCPLAESAAAERMKLLGETDRVRAAVAARDYLQAYPNGFARGDAEALQR